MSRKPARQKEAIDRGMASEVGNAPDVNLHFQSKVQMTVKMAYKLLENDQRIQNRTVSEALVNRFARMMVGGKWHLDGNPIKEDEEGKLLDGQHRLWAFIKAAEIDPNVVVYFSIVKGVDESSLLVMDTGRKRGLNDFLGIQGKKNTAVMAAAARWLWWYDNVRTGNLTSIGGATNPEMAMAIAAHPLIEEASSLVAGSSEAKAKVPSGGLAFLLTKGLEINRVTTETFLYGLNNGSGLDDGSPILQLRRRMDRLPKGGGATNTMKKTALAIKAWNMFKLGLSNKALVWYPERGEQFPRFHGE